MVLLTALVVLALVAVVIVQEMRADRLKAQVKRLRASRDLHARALEYAPENAREGVWIDGLDTSRSLVWVSYTGPRGELAIPDALQKILVGTWTRVQRLSGPGQAVYEYRAPRAPRDEQR